MDKLFEAKNKMLVTHLKTDKTKQEKFRSSKDLLLFYIGYWDEFAYSSWG